MRGRKMGKGETKETHFLKDQLWNEIHCNEY